MNGHIKIGRVIRRTVAVYFGEASVLLSVAVICVLLPMAFGGLVLGESSDSLSVDSARWLVPIAVVVVVVLALALFTAAVIGLVADAHDSRGKVSVRRRLRSVSLRVLGRLILVGLVAGVVIYILLTVEFLFLVALLLWAVFGHVFALDFTPVGLVLGVLASTMILLIPGLILLTVWSVAAPVVVLERPRGLRALRRSRELVRGNGWRVFGVIAAVALAVNIVGRGIERGAGYAFGFGPGVAAAIIVWVLALPVPVIVAAVLYFELREATASDLPDGATPPQTPTPLDMPLPSTAASDLA